MKDLTEEEIFRLNFEIWIKGSQVKSVGGGRGGGQKEHMPHIPNKRKMCIQNVRVLY